MQEDDGSPSQAFGGELRLLEFCIALVWGESQTHDAVTQSKFWGLELYWVEVCDPCFLLNKMPVHSRLPANKSKEGLHRWSHKQAQCLTSKQMICYWPSSLSGSYNAFEKEAGGHRSVSKRVYKRRCWKKDWTWHSTNGVQKTSYEALEFARVKDTRSYAGLMRFALLDISWQ